MNRAYVDYAVKHAGERICKIIKLARQSGQPL